MRQKYDCSKIKFVSRDPQRAISVFEQNEIRSVAIRESYVQVAFYIVRPSHALKLVNRPGDYSKFS